MPPKRHRDYARSRESVSRPLSSFCRKTRWLHRKTDRAAWAWTWTSMWTWTVLSEVYFPDTIFTRSPFICSCPSPRPGRSPSPGRRVKESRDRNYLGFLALVDCETDSDSELVSASCFAPAYQAICRAIPLSMPTSSASRPARPMKRRSENIMCRAFW